MRIECPRCRSLVEVRDFACEAPARLTYTCPACQAAVSETAGASPAPAPVQAPQVEVPEDLADLWAAVEADYDAPARHEAFVSACEARGALHVAAARYRAHATAHGPHPETERRIRLITLLAQARALPRARPEKAGPDPVRRAVAVGLLLLALVLLLVLLAPTVARLRRAQHGDAVGPRPTPPPAVRNLAEMRPSP